MDEKKILPFMALSCCITVVRLKKLLGVLVLKVEIAKGVIVDNKRGPDLFIFQGQSAMTDGFVATRNCGNVITTIIVIIMI